MLARAYLHDYMPAVRNLSDKSVDAYKQSLKTCLAFLEEAKSLTEDKVTFDAFVRDNIKEYITWLKGKNFAPKTINLKLTAIRSFLKYCSEEDFELRGRIYGCLFRAETKRRENACRISDTTSYFYDPGSL